MATKHKWLAIAEIVDAFRIIPRLMLAGYCCFYIWYIWWCTTWYFGLENPESTSTTFITATITGLGGMATWFSNTYLKSGRKWANLPEQAAD